LLLGGIAGQPPPERATRLPVELIVRDSCGAALPTAQHENQE
jgi:DNA-binding LacI/PurR family transcriptional regulator